MKEKREKKKRPYRSPTVKTSKLYEQKALACGKQVTSGTIACKTNPKVS